MPRKKLQLRVDDLSVATFDPVAGEAETLGTVQANEDMPPTTEFCTLRSYCPTRCIDTTCCFEAA